MRRNRPGRGAVLEVRVTHAQRIGHVWRYKFRFYKNPTLQEDLCLRPGAKTPKRCPRTGAHAAAVAGLAAVALGLGYGAASLSGEDEPKQPSSTKAGANSCRP